MILRIKPLFFALVAVFVLAAFMPGSVEADSSHDDRCDLPFGCGGPLNQDPDECTGSGDPFCTTNGGGVIRPCYMCMHQQFLGMGVIYACCAGPDDCDAAERDDHWTIDRSRGFDETCRGDSRAKTCVGPRCG